MVRIAWIAGMARTDLRSRGAPSGWRPAGAPECRHNGPRKATVMCLNLCDALEPWSVFVNSARCARARGAAPAAAADLSGASSNEIACVPLRQCTRSLTVGRIRCFAASPLHLPGCSKVGEIAAMSSPGGPRAPRYRRRQPPLKLRDTIEDAPTITAAFGHAPNNWRDVLAADPRAAMVIRPQARGRRKRAMADDDDDDDDHDDDHDDDGGTAAFGGAPSLFGGVGDVFVAPGRGPRPPGFGDVVDNPMSSAASALLASHAVIVERRQSRAAVLPPAAAPRSVDTSAANRSGADDYFRRGAATGSGGSGGTDCGDLVHAVNDASASAGQAAAGDSCVASDMLVSSRSALEAAFATIQSRALSSATAEVVVRTVVDGIASTAVLELGDGSPAGRVRARRNVELCVRCGPAAGVGGALGDRYLECALAIDSLTEDFCRVCSPTPITCTYLPLHGCRAHAFNGPPDPTQARRTALQGNLEKAIQARIWDAAKKRRCAVGPRPGGPRPGREATDIPDVDSAAAAPLPFPHVAPIVLGVRKRRRGALETTPAAGTCATRVGCGLGIAVMLRAVWSARELRGRHEFRLHSFHLRHCAGAADAGEAPPSVASRRVIVEAPLQASGGVGACGARGRGKDAAAVLRRKWCAHKSVTSPPPPQPIHTCAPPTPVHDSNLTHAQRRSHLRRPSTFSCPGRCHRRRWRFLRCRRCHWRIGCLSSFRRRVSTRDSRRGSHLRSTDCQLTTPWLSRRARPTTQTTTTP